LSRRRATQENFAGFDRATADIKFISIVGGVSGFTVDDLTYAGAAAPPSAVPEPGTLTCLGLGLLGLIRQQRLASGRAVPLFVRPHGHCHLPANRANKKPRKPNR
jgi:hypothetical protein